MLDDKQIAAEIAAAKYAGKNETPRPGNAEDRLLPSPSEPIAVARQFIEDHFAPNGVLTLHYWRSGWWEWQTAHWKEIDDRALRAKLYNYTEHALYIFFDKKEGPKSVPWSPTRRKISDLADALAAICILEGDIDQPCWLDDCSEAGIIVSVANGLLDVEQKKLLPHTPLFFNQTSVPFAYDPDAPAP